MGRSGAEVDENGDPKISPGDLFFLRDPYKNRRNRWWLCISHPDKQGKNSYFYFDDVPPVSEAWVTKIESDLMRYGFTKVFLNPEKPGK